MQTYLNLLRQVYNEGQPKTNRTGITTRSLFGAQLRFPMSNGFPAVTTKRLAFRAVVGELIGFIQGYSNAADFRRVWCGVWDANAAAPYWQNNPHCRGTDDLGRIYGVQWNQWKTHMPILNDDNQILGYKTFNQLEDVIERIKTNPDDRRLIVSAWNAWEIHDGQMALPPCHVMFQFNVRGDYLDLHMYQRSADMFLGVPFNIASYSMLLHMVAQVTNLHPGDFIHSFGDVHIYENHLGQVRTQLERTPYPLPTLKLNPKVTSLWDFTPHDIMLIDYEHYPPITGEMAV